MEEMDMEAGTNADCITACSDCSRVCQAHVPHCLSLGGEHATAEHIAMLLSCARVCENAAALMALDSGWYPTFCELCAEVCDECADACEDMDDMDDCVAACRACAEACRAMVAEIEASQDDEDEDSEEEQDENRTEPARASY